MENDQADKAQRGMEVPMVEPEVVRQIRGFAAIGWGAKRIASELEIARNTVRRYLHLPALPEAIVQQRPQGRRLTAAQAVEAVRLFEGAAEGNAVVVRRLLAEQSVEASLRTVQKAVQPKRRELRRAQVASVRFETAPGKQLQIDFGEKWVIIGGQRVRVYLFVAVLGYSRRIFVKPFLSQRQDDWHEGITAALHHFGGVPETLLIDNPKSLVIEHHHLTRTVTLHPSFAAFCKEWDITAKACAPYRARTKGKTESGVKYAKRNGLAGLSFTAFAALEIHLSAWMQLADSRVHGTTHEKPMVRFDRDERDALRPLPARPAPARQRSLKRRVANDALVNVDTIRYSVPHRFVREFVQVQVLEHEVRIFAGAELVATHQRAKEPHSTVTESAHYDGLWRVDAAASEQSPNAAALSPLEVMGRSLNDYAAVVEGGIS